MSAIAVITLALGIGAVFRRWPSIEIRLQLCRTVFVVALSLLLVAMLATYWPARRATRVDPLIALRAD